MTLIELLNIKRISRFPSLLYLTNELVRNNDSHPLRSIKKSWVSMAILIEKFNYDIT